MSKSTMRKNITNFVVILISLGCLIGSIITVYFLIFHMKYEQNTALMAFMAGVLITIPSIIIPAIVCKNVGKRLITKV